MPFFLLGDEWADDPSWDVLSDGSAALADRLQSAYARLGTRASAQRRDGYVTERFALDACRGSRKVVNLLATAVLDVAPWLHRPGDECDCLGDAPWIEGYAYRLHNFLKRNPARKETDRDKAQKADLRDARLKQLVYERDGGCCRYCRSGPLSAKAGRSKDRRRVLSHDHVDPDRPAGPNGENFVVTCGRCNEHKGRRTPDEADMLLLPEPTPEEITSWQARGPVRLDRPTHRQKQTPNSDETATEHCSDVHPNTDPNTDRPPDPIADPQPDQTGEVRPENGRSPAQTHTQPPSGGGGLGWGGQPVPDVIPAPPDTARGSVFPDIYHRRSRAPTANRAQPPPVQHTGLPPPGEEPQP